MKINSPQGRKREIKMKEFKFYSDGFELPVSVCKTQKEAVYEITSAREALKLLDKEGECEGGCEKLIIDVIYKDGSTYYNSNNYAEEGKFKRTGIARAIVSTEYGTVVFGDFAITEYGDVTIEESEIEEYGVYAGQYDVKEQDEQEVQEVSETETNETTAETTAEQETVEGISKMEIPTETGNSGFEYTRSQAQEIIVAGTSIAREKYREKHGIYSPMDLKKFSRKQLDDYLSKELDYINKFLNDTLPKEVFNAMKGETMYA